MAKPRQISFSKEYVMEIVIAELRKRHSIPEDFVSKVNDYRSDYLTFSEVQIKDEETA